MRGSTDDSRSLVWVAAICVLALVLRIFVIVNTVESGIFADMQDYYDRAVHLVKTGTLWPDAFRVPLFPIVTAAIFKAFGESLVAVRVAQALLGAATVALTYVLARRVTSDRGARWAAFIVAIYPALLLYVVYLMAETLFTFFVVLALVLWSRERSRDAFFAGMVIGLATLTRSTGVAVLAGIGLTELLRLVWRRHDGALGLMTRAALLVGHVIALHASRSGTGLCTESAIDALKRREVGHELLDRTVGLLTGGGHQPKPHERGCSHTTLGKEHRGIAPTSYRTRQAGTSILCEVRRAAPGALAQSARNQAQRGISGKPRPSKPRLTACAGRKSR